MKPAPSNSPSNLRKLGDYDAYLFDLDGTISQSLVPWLQIVRKTMQDYGIEASDKAVVRQVFGRTREGLIELGIPKSDLPTIFAEWDAKSKENVRVSLFYPHITEVLLKLKKRGSKLGLITATVRPAVNELLSSRNLHDVFTVTVTGDEVSAHKPHPEGILFALQKMGVTGDRAVMLGDSDKDIRAAHNAGVDSVLFFPPEHEAFHDLEQLKADEPTFIIDSWQQMLEALQ